MINQDNYLTIIHGNSLYTIISDKYVKTIYVYIIYMFLKFTREVY